MLLRKNVTYETEVNVSVTATGATTDAALLAEAITNVGMNGVSAEVNAQNKVVIKHSEGGEIKFTDTDGGLDLQDFAPICKCNKRYSKSYYSKRWHMTVTQVPSNYISNWKVLTYTASDSAVTQLSNRLSTLGIVRC